MGAEEEQKQAAELTLCCRVEAGQVAQLIDTALRSKICCSENCKWRKQKAAKDTREKRKRKRSRKRRRSRRRSRTRSRTSGKHQKLHYAAELRRGKQINLLKLSLK